MIYSKINSREGEFAHGTNPSFGGPPGEPAQLPKIIQIDTLPKIDRKMNIKDNFSQTLTREALEQALRKVGEKLRQRGVQGEIAIYRGAAMLLAFEIRATTKDVDAVFRPTREIREAAKEVSFELNLPEHWLNDGVKGFISEKNQLIPFPDWNLPALRITMPTPEYLLAMKCMASRINYLGDPSQDEADIAFLIKKLNLTHLEEVFKIIENYYPPSQIPVKTKFLVETIFEKLDMITLAQVAQWIRHGAQAHYALANFLEDFYSSPSYEAFKEEPTLLANFHEEGQVLDAYLAAMADHLSNENRWIPPAWTIQSNRALSKPWFANPHPFLRSTLIVESPAAFRERGLFVSENALQRA